jgi:hypothetical protein
MWHQQEKELVIGACLWVEPDVSMHSKFALFFNEDFSPPKKAACSKGSLAFLILSLLEACSYPYFQKVCYDNEKKNIRDKNQCQLKRQ